MAWREATVLGQRLEFVHLATAPGANVLELCRRFGVSSKTAYKWMGRYAKEGSEGLADRSRRPLGSPKRTEGPVETEVVELRDTYPDWGGRKLRRLLVEQGMEDVPSASTITEILRRHERLSPALAGKAAAWQRFEHEAPNQLWQMDFKGHFALVDGKGSRCHPLTILDDHSRFNICLRACADEREETVKEALQDVFRLYGMPLRITADNGSPWGNSNTESITGLAVWLIRLGVKLSHSRPFHPQTQGKDERFHRTLKLELLERCSFDSNPSAQVGFDPWRDRYNLVRPHEALGMKPPVSRYTVSPRKYPEILAAVEYDSSEQVRRVQANGAVSFRGREYVVGRGLTGLPVALREAGEGGEWEAYLCGERVARFRLGSVAQGGSAKRTGAEVGS